MMRLAVVSLLLVFSVVCAQGVEYHYHPLKVRPSDIYFRPTATEMACAGLLNPSSDGEVGLNVSGVMLQLDCPQEGPVVVWGENSRGNKKFYAINTIRIRFYGPGTYDGQYGVDTLMEILKRDYLMRLLASGDLEPANVQYEAPVREPTIDSPLPDSPSWRRWRGDEAIEIDDALVSRKKNLGRGNRTCRKFYDDRCWRADFTWALPVRLVLSGSEAGFSKIDVSLPEWPEKVFVEASSGQSATLSVSGGVLLKIDVLPTTFVSP